VPSTPVIVRLTSAHRTEEFDCGKPPLDIWLKAHALASQAAGTPRTFVIAEANRVVGYYSLTVSAVQPEDAPVRVREGQGGYPISVFLLARLAVDGSVQGRGLGALLLRDALFRCVRASEDVGARAVLVHAIDEDARTFYEHFNFEESPTHPLHMMLLMKDLKAWLRESA
jgi:GNAT superfamily N-acetyltransferase